MFRLTSINLRQPKRNRWLMAALLTLPIHGAQWNQTFIYVSPAFTYSPPPVSMAQRVIPPLSNPTTVRYVAYRPSLAADGKVTLRKQNADGSWSAPDVIENMGNSLGDVAVGITTFGSPRVAHYHIPFGVNRYVERVAEGSGSGCVNVPVTHWKCSDMVPAVGGFSPALGLWTTPTYVSTSYFLFNVSSGTSAAKSARFTKLDNTSWAIPATIPKAGYAIAMDDTGSEQHILISNGNPPHTTWIKRANNAWSQPETIAAEASHSGDLQVKGGIPHACHHSQGKILYSTRNGSQWSPKKIVGSTLNAGYWGPKAGCSLAFANGRPVIAYIDENEGHLKVTRQMADLTNWTVPEIVAVGAPGQGVGYWPTLVNKDGKLMVSYSSMAGHVYVSTEQ